MEEGPLVGSAVERLFITYDLVVGCGPEFKNNNSHSVTQIHPLTINACLNGSADKSFTSRQYTQRIYMLMKSN
jgi:hypothetical protein